MAAFLQWSPALDTGLPVIDHQHRRIVEYINMLFDAGTGGDRAALKAVLDELVDYTLTHFAFEEQLMEEGGYAFLKAHKRVHELFRKRIGTYFQRFAAGEEVAGELLEMLKRWLVGHIKNEDADYVEPVRRVLEKHAPTPQAEAASPVPSGWLAGAFRRLFAY